jgi:hypothetical protein
MGGAAVSHCDAALRNRASWYAEGLRWIGTLLINAADTLARPSFVPSSLEPHPERPLPEEYLFDVRNRIYSGFGAGGERPYY